MDLLTMKHDSVSGWQVDDLIEDWSSLIWTERYRDASEFELRTPAINDTLTAMPQDTIIALRESNEVMITDTLNIEKNDDGESELVVRGRGFETFLTRRATRNTAIVPTDGDAYPTAIVQTYIHHAVVSGEPNAGWVADIIPNVVSEAPPWGPFEELEAENPEELYYYPVGKHVGNVYSVAMDLLAKHDVGLRSVRSADGNITIESYYFEDRSSTVVFRHDAGHFSEEDYLFSDTDYRTVAYVVSPIGFRIVYAPGVNTAATGLQRRVLQVDASDITSAGGQTAANLLDTRGRQELAKHNRTKLFGAQLSPDAPFKYKTDYFLGDKVKIIGQYGVSALSRIREYIRVQDAEGERAFPTLNED